METAQSSAVIFLCCWKVCFDFRTQQGNWILLFAILTGLPILSVFFSSFWIPAPIRKWETGGGKGGVRKLKTQVYAVHLDFHLDKGALCLNLSAKERAGINSCWEDSAVSCQNEGLIHVYSTILHWCFFFHQNNCKGIMSLDPCPI